MLRARQPWWKRMMGLWIALVVGLACWSFLYAVDTLARWP